MHILTPDELGLIQAYFRYEASVGETPLGKLINSGLRKLLANYQEALLPEVELSRYQEETAPTEPSIL